MTNIFEILHWLAEKHITREYRQRVIGEHDARLILAELPKSPFIYTHKIAALSDDDWLSLFEGMYRASHYGPTGGSSKEYIAIAAREWFIERGEK